MESSQEDCHRLAAIVSKAAEATGVPFESIEEVIVATPETFGDIVGRFDKSRKYTNSRGIVAAGKLYTHRPANKRMTHSILLQHSVVAGFFRAMDSAHPTIDDWPPEDQRNLYVLFHELGHCLDHERRSEDTDDGTFRTGSGERAIEPTFRGMCAYYHSILLSELAACVFSGFMFTAAARVLDCRMNDTFVRTQLVKLKGMTTETPGELEAIRAEAAGLCWFILMQQAKEAGSRLGNPQLPSAPPTELWQIARVSDRVAAILEKADEAIRAAWSSYPVFPASFRDQLSDCFVELGEFLGYSFQKNGMDGVWWRYFAQMGALLALEAEDPAPAT
ncbi:MAG: hypothetical protein Q7S40_28545 [Opitutaceae bacterium]|nr:hypothetical protein [Opitutaceae bacterium]